MAEKQKIGIMGGTFDPIHIGHLILAQSAYEQLHLDRVLFIPAGKPPHKRDRDGAKDEQRIRMVKLAIEEDPHFDISLIEMESEEYSYTYLTLKKLKEQNPDHDYYFIIGQDSLETFSSWYKPEEIVKYAHIAAADRPDCDQSRMEELLQKNRDLFHGDFIGISCPDIQISSSEIRRMAGEQKSFRYFVPDSVYRYINENAIYRKDRDQS